MCNIYKVILDGKPDLACPYISLTDPASVAQIIRALKAEGVLARNARFSSFEICEPCEGQSPGDIYLNRIAGGDWDWPLRLALCEE